ncbi:glutaredoxin family protein [Knoellia locipacati]|uniref:glutaredoxin family protein n=1 Tax=Knoellia locipacati TaxID=882824 RepID=UPI00384EDA02
MPSGPDPAPAPDERPAPEARVTLIGKPGCHLCDAARAVVAQVTDELGESFVERSVLDEPELMARYAEEIPVTLVDGRQHDFWRVDADRLRAALERPQA